MSCASSHNISRSSQHRFAWGCLLHLGYNMWEDREAPELPARQHQRVGREYLRCDKGLWDELTQRLADNGGNMVVIDLAEGVEYESHPEIGAKGAWSVQQLREELTRLRGLGLEPIPKLNFSAAHDHWLGPYSRCISTDTYYAVCRDLIDEVIQVFDQPRLFHLGMDEETPQHQKNFNYVAVRQHELWWHDLHFLVDRVERNNVRAWVWADCLWVPSDWRSREEYFRKMPRSVMQSNWYYGEEFGEDLDPVKAYLDLEAHGYDQIPTGSNHRVPDNLQRTARYLTERIDPKRLHGFLQASWRITLPEFRERHIQAIDAVDECVSEFQPV